MNTARRGPLTAAAAGAVLVVFAAGALRGRGAAALRGAVFFALAVVFLAGDRVAIVPAL